jgi:hypothetical protein
MFITKRHLSRRAVLESLGVSLSLPLLDSMYPAAANGRSLTKTCFVVPEMVHGAAGNTTLGRARN